MDRRKFLTYMGCGCGSLLLSSCSTAPITDRRQLKLIPESKLNAQAAQLYEKVKQKAKLSDDKESLDKIIGIGSKIETSITEYFYKNAQALRLIKKENNVDVRSFSSEIVEMFFKHSEDIIEENTKDSEDYKNIYKSWLENIELFNEYHQYSDNAYMKLRLKYQSN